ncbi:MAG: octaprenyl diphosphate synthase [Gammaproteobacteria bacterium RIFCSPHIGHO2_12_FULL_38_11]|nr:MAG: octaprenyl diphosphate synthase [Gammaproteobacteria bacterium RIFCSPHIGHO2_12_FULL_38_11]
MQTSSQKLSKTTEILPHIRALIADDLAAVDSLIHQELASKVPLTREITEHIFKTKGKRLRPLLIILTSHAFSNGKPLSKIHYELAAVIEFVHTATLLHDDVVDHSNLRRGQQTANAIWGNASSVLVGDFLYSRAFQILARHDQRDVMCVLSQTTNAIAEGEVMQLMNQHDADLSEENYFHVITQKTAQLFSAAAKIGAILENTGKKEQSAISEYGLYLGIIFQIIDDLLDYETSAEITGKNIGDDLAEGKATLPLIYAIQNATPKESQFMRNAIKNGDTTALPEILIALKKTNAFELTRNKAKEYAVLANATLQSIPESAYKKALKELVVFAVKRNY